jgi:hypothetical protein
MKVISIISMKLQELATLHIRENILSEATIIKYNSVVLTFVKGFSLITLNSIAVCSKARKCLR